MGFHQPNWTVHGDVYNNEGTLILSKNSSPADFIGVIRGLKADVDRLQGVDDTEKTQLHALLDGTLEQAASAKPNKDDMVESLSAVNSRLERLGRVAAGALALANVFSNVITWVSGHF